MSESQKSTCCTCGFSWITGENGRHSCSIYMTGTIARLEADKKDLEKVLKCAVGWNWISYEEAGLNDIQEMNDILELIK